MCISMRLIQTASCLDKYRPSGWNPLLSDNRKRVLRKQGSFFVVPARVILSGENIPVGCFRSRTRPKEGARSAGSTMGRVVNRPRSCHRLRLAALRVSISLRFTQDDTGGRRDPRTIKFNEAIFVYSKRVVATLRGLGDFVNSCQAKDLDSFYG